MASENIEQIFTANPITTNAGTDLMYFGQSPYGVGDDAAMLYSNFALQFGAPYTAAALTEANDTNVTLTLGGTGVNNGASTLTYAGNVSFSGAFTFAATLTANTAVTFPTSGTLATTSQLPTPAALTETNDTNVTLTLGGTPATALLQAVSITAGWSGQLSLARGGTNASLTAVAGGIPYSTASALALSAAGTIGQFLQSGGTGTPTWVNSPIGTGTAPQFAYYAANGGTLSPLTLPSFSAYDATGTTLVAGAFTPITFNTKNFDIGTHFNTTTFKWTPGLAGIYRLSAFVYLTTAVASTEYVIQVLLNGSGVTNSVFSGVTGLLNLNVTGLYQLAATDTVAISVFNGGISNIVTQSGSSNCMFAGEFVGAGV